MSHRQGIASADVILMVLCSVLVACSREPVDQQGVIPAATRRAPVTPVSNDCAVRTADAVFVTGLDVYPVPNLAEPVPRQWFVDPTFGTCLIRVTDRERDPSADDDSRGMVNEYSRVQSFNADGSRLLVYSIEGWWYLYDAQTLLAFAELPLGVEPRWHAEDPALIYYLDEMRLMSYDVANETRAEVHDFAGDFPD